MMAAKTTTEQEIKLVENRMTLFDYLNEFEWMTVEVEVSRYES